MAIERIYTRSLPVATVDVIDVAKKIVDGLTPSVIEDRILLKGGVYKISDSPLIREELEVLDDGSGVYRRIPSRQRLRALGLNAGKGISYHLPHDKNLIVLRGPGVNPDGNIIGVLVYRNGT